MGRVFPREREEKLRALLDAVEDVRETLTAGVDEAEAIATLSAATVDALYESGLFALKLPAAFGGAEADPVTQLKVIEALTRIDPSAGWCTMIGASAAAMLAVFLPDEAIEQVFAGGRVPRAAGVFMPSGKAVSTEGGYIVSGRWSFASGILHSQWVSAGTLVAPDGSNGADERSGTERRMVVFPTSEAQIHDNWQVVGLKGTGSNDFSVSNLFVPEAFTWDVMRALPKRGGPLYHLGIPGFVANEHSAFALGVGRRALDAIIELAREKRRGYGSTSPLAMRPSFQRAVGECDLRLRASRALVIEILDEAWETVCRDYALSPGLQAEMRSSAAFTTEVAVDVASLAFRYGGGEAVYLSSTLQRCLRDINTAAQHLMVSDSSYENHGQFALGLPNANAMG